MIEPVSLVGMTHAKWTRLPANVRKASYDPSELVPALLGYEGARIEVEYPDGTLARYWVSRSTGWKPCHIEVKTKRSMGGMQVYWPEGTKVRQVIKYKHQ